ncbi:MAG: EAL domain-containing protein [Candidatus Nanopelagicales bacterium]
MTDRMTNSHASASMPPEHPTDDRPFERLVNNCRDLVVWVRDGVVIWASSACEQFGWSPTELVGLRAIELVHRDDRYLSQAAKESRDIESEAIRLRFRFTTGSGGYRWVEAHTSPHTNEHGEVDGTVSVIRDVSAQVATEAELRQSEREFKLLAENAADVVIRFDEQHVRRWVSASVRDLLGWDPESFLALPLNSLIHPDDQPNEHFGGELPSDLIDTAPEFRIKHGDGRWVWVSRKSRTLIDGSHIEALRCINDEVMARQLAESAIADLSYRAHHDALTGLMNRDAAIEYLAHALAAQPRHGEVGVLLIDVDRFKEVNDGVSHSVGDDILARVAGILRSALSERDSVGRLGGDEFVVILESVEGSAELVECARRLVESISAATFFAQAQPVSVTASIGVVAAELDQHAHSVLSDADAALREAKQTGGNRWVLADESIRSAAAHRLGLNRRIRSGLDGGQFHAWYQPIVDLADRKILGYEALARWITPDGVVAASEFIAAAEDSGMITELGNLVIAESIARIPFLPAHQTMCINASASQLGNAAFGPYVLEQLRATDATPAQLVIEITEHSLLELDDQAQAGLTALTDLGVGIYIDDFGTGYSSLATLLDYPVTGLKLDRDFAQRLAKDPTGPTSHLVSGLLDLTERLSLRGIAEGIETAQQEQLLRSLGWHCGQGWLFGAAEPPSMKPPVPAMRRHVEIDLSDRSSSASHSVD